MPGGLSSTVSAGHVQGVWAGYEVWELWLSCSLAMASRREHGLSLF